MDNFSQLNIIQKIEELREKQRQEEEKLLRQQEEQRKLLTVKQQKLYEIFGLQENGYEELQSCSSKHHLASSLDKRSEVTSMKKISDTVTKQTLDETPAANSNANFLQLLQDKLNEMEDNNISPPPRIDKPKKKFLKKGEGLARFRMKPENFKLKSRTLSVEKADHESKSELDQTAAKKNVNGNTVSESMMDRKYNQCLKEINLENDGLSAALNGSIPRASWTAVQQRGHYSPGKDSIENSFLEKVQEAEKKSKKELEELRVFELLEEQAQNSSFCSNSSLFTHLMNDSVKSTPIKVQEDAKNKQLLLDNRENVLAGSCFQNKALDLLYYHLNSEEQENVAPKHENNFVHTSNLKNGKPLTDDVIVNNLHVRFSDKNDYRSCSEEISEESHCIDSGRKGLKLSDLRNECGDFQDDDVWSDGCSSETSESGDCSLVITETVLASNKAKTRAEEQRLKNTVNNASSLCSEVIDEVLKKSVKEIGVNTEIVRDDIQFQTSLLQTKLQDLEKEIEIFRKENANLQKAQQKHQQEVAKFSREKKDLEVKMKEEREQLETALQEERKKLQRQKMVFDKYCKETRKNPSKQEREEIQTLKQKIQELQEVIHKKDSKWSNLQARSRDREKYLEKENRHLKEELEVFKKAKATQKAKAVKHQQISKTKILHAINDHIAKLTPNDLEDAIIIHDVIPKKVSPTFLKKYSTATIDDAKISEEEVHQHTAYKNLTSTQGYFNIAGQHMLPMPKPESHPSPLHLSNLELNSQSSVEEAKQSSGNSANCKKQDIIKSGRSAYATYSYFPPSKQADSETDNHFKNYELQEDKVLSSGSQYDSELSEKTIHSNKVLSEESDGENTQGTDKTKRSNLIQSISSRRSEFVMQASPDSVSESLASKNFPVDAVIENRTAEGGREKIYPDGRQEIWYANGNVKKISADRSTTKTIFYNGDVRERLSDGTVKYYFAETKVWQTTNPDGSELMEYSNGQVELRMADGTLETTFPDLSQCTVYPDGRQKHVYKDGKVMEKNPLLGLEVTSYPNGQREICSKDHMPAYLGLEENFHIYFQSDNFDSMDYPRQSTSPTRLEYPDGTVKILYPDGLQETRYSNGRIRIKDKAGKLIMDSLQNESDSFNLQDGVTQ